MLIIIVSIIINMLSWVCFALAVGKHSLHHSVASAMNLREIIERVPFWDYTSATIDGKTVRFGKKLNFTADERKVWNTAVMFAIEDGLPLPFVHE